MTHVTIPYQTGTLVVLGDLHFDRYQRHALNPIRAWGLEDILWVADALIGGGRMR
ncbi:conserved hypothetical protein [Ruegeria lacuscaerulensis ITI-1157]|nr:conserved hypothetical protein [Ruegeria lacuscaerulensis ITI-1157]SHK24584.1 hypothetical protein SAMN05444404_3557 [Ruegeria lacuscaerulensis ITI-1157]